MFVSKSKYEVMTGKAAEAVIAAVQYKNKYLALLQEWNELVNKLNSKGGAALLDGQASQPPQFSKDELQRLIQLCHPDKHDGKEMATEITAKLVKMKEKM